MERHVEGGKKGGGIVCKCLYPYPSTHSLTLTRTRMPHHRQVPNIPSLIYFCRRNPGEPYISPKARTITQCRSMVSVDEWTGPRRRAVPIPCPLVSGNDDDHTHMHLPTHPHPSSSPKHSLFCA